MIHFRRELKRTVDQGKLTTIPYSINLENELEHILNLSIGMEILH